MENSTKQICTISAQDVAFKMGRILLENGAEIGRVQQTMEIVSKAYDIKDYDVFVLTNAIFANTCEEGKIARTKFKYIPTFSIHFGKIAAINQLSRDIVAGKLTTAEAGERLHEIESMVNFKNITKILCCAIGSGCFCYVYGGNFFDSINAFFCGLSVESILITSQKHQLSKFITNLSASAVAAFLASLLFILGLGSNLDSIIIGSIIRLVPGIVLTTGIRDFLNSDYLSGTIRIIDAIIVGICITCGVGSVLSIMNFFVGGIL